MQNIATASIGYPRDLYTKAQKAGKMEGYRFILIDAPCPTGWDSDPAITRELGKLAVQTGYFPLYEIEDGKLTFSNRGKKYRDPANRIPVEEYLNRQGRFKKMTSEQTTELKKDLQFEWDKFSRME